MIARRTSLAARGALAGAVVAGVLAFPAPGDRGSLDILSHFSTLADGGGIGVGGDGSTVFFTSFFSVIPPEEPITAADLQDKPYLRNNADLFTWEPSRDAVEQFTATADIENAEGTAVGNPTFNDQPAVDCRSLAVFKAGEPLPVRERTVAVAFRSNADQTIPGPLTTPDDVDPRVASLGATGSTVYVWDSQRKTFDSVFEFILTPFEMALGSPSLAMKTRILEARVDGHSGNVPTGLQIRDVLVAFAGNADPASDNGDGNDEIFLWSRKAFLEDGQPGGGGLRNGGVVQVTHTVDVPGETPIPVDCSSPAVNGRGEVAFVSNADITGENPDGSLELFLWRRGATRQVTNVSSGTFGTPRWSADGRLLVFESTADIVRRNPDESSEIFAWDGHRVRQVTEGTTGGSHAPSVDGRGRAIAFVTDADLEGVFLNPIASREVVVADRTGRNLRQVTTTPADSADEEQTLDSETPFLTGSGTPVVLTWVSSGNLDGRNSNHSRRIYRTSLGARPSADQGSGL